MSSETAATAHILTAISGHGYGHLAQCAPILEALKADNPRLMVSICSVFPRELIARRLAIPFNYHFAELDPVLQMRSAWEVDVPASQRVYRTFHRHWEAGMQRDRALLTELAPDLVLADIPYRLLLAAQALHIRAVALCSLNWADVYAAYCEPDGKDAAILAQMHEAYRSAHCFLLPQPAMPMPQLENTRAIGPVARQGRAQKAALNALCGKPPATRIVLVALGGIDTDMPLTHWPRSANTVWLFASAVHAIRDDMLDLDALPMSFIDVMASADVVLTKPGYGTYCEAVCNGVAVLSLQRDDWPETAVLNRWVTAYGRLGTFSADQFRRGAFLPELTALLSMDVPAAVYPAGIKEAVHILQGLLPVTRSA